MFVFPNIDPVILSFGPFAISYYSLSYVIGIILGAFYAGKLADKYSASVNSKIMEEFVTYAVIGIIIGGRLGYVFFYDFSKFINHPIDILKTYEGGMSFHGGFAGIIVASLLFCRKYKITFLSLTDLLSVVSPIGLLLGRIANFINGELYGRTTDLPWAFVFPHSDRLPRHPSQLYEAFLEGFCLLIIMFLNRKKLQLPGYNSGLFLICYGLFRIIIECFREPDAQIGFLFGMTTMGQLLSFPMVGLGIWVLYLAVFIIPAKDGIHKYNQNRFPPSRE